jgi:ketosteroid isomerase-like protein
MRPLAFMLVAALACTTTTTTTTTTETSSTTASPNDPQQVRREVEAAYARMATAFEQKDLEGVLGPRTDDFHTTGPDGRQLGTAEMRDYLRNWLQINHPPIDVKFTIRDIEMSGPDEAKVTVLQEASRMQEQAGKMRKVDHNVVQRETWRRTPEGWKIAAVDRVRDQRRWVDGKRVDPTKRFDPDAPPFDEASATRTEIEQRYRNLATAYNTQDIDTILWMRMPDIVVDFGNNERRDAKQMADALRQFFVTNKPPIDVRFTIRDFQIINPNEVVVTVLQEASRQQELAGKLRKVNHEVVQRETWVRTPDAWKVKQVDSIRDQKRWVDGKRVDPSKPYDPDAPPFDPQ